MAKYYIEVKIESSNHITYGSLPNKNNEIITSFQLKTGEQNYQAYQCNFNSSQISDSGFYEHVYSGNVNLIYPLGVNSEGTQIELTEDEAFYEIYQLVHENEQSYLMGTNNVMFNNCYVSYYETLSGGISFTIVNMGNNITIPIWAIVKKTTGLNGIYRLVKPYKEEYQIEKIYDLSLLKTYYDNGGLYFDNLTSTFIKGVDEYIDLNDKVIVKNCYDTSSRGYKLEFISKMFFNTLEEANEVLKKLKPKDPPICLAEQSYDGLILPVNSKPFFIRQPQWFLVEYVDILNNELVKTEAVEFWKNEEIPELYLNKYYISEGQKYLYPGYDHVTLIIKNVCPYNEKINNELYAWYYFYPPEITITNEEETFTIPLNIEWEKDLSEYYSINYSNLEMSFEVIDGELPPGMQVDTDGRFHGICEETAIGNYTFTLKATSFRCENEIIFKSVKVTKNEIFGIVQNKEFVFFYNRNSSFDLKEGLSQSPLDQDYIFTSPQGFPTNVSLTGDGVLSANITSDYGFEFEGETNSGDLISHEESIQKLNVKTTSSSDYEMSIKLIYERYFLELDNTEFSLETKYEQSKTMDIPIVYNIPPELLVENSINGVIVSIEENCVRITTDGLSVIEQDFNIILNKDKISEKIIVVHYSCSSNEIILTQNEFDINGYWFKSIEDIDLKNYVSNTDNSEMIFSIDETTPLPSGITFENGILSGTFSENTSSTIVNIIISAESAFDKIIKINFNIKEWYFNIPQLEFNLIGITNQLNVLEICEVEYNKPPAINKINSSDYNISYFFEENKLKCSFNISEEVSFDETIEINGINILIHYSIGEVVFLNIEEHLNNFVYYEYPLTSGATTVTNIEYEGFRECTDYLTYVGNISGYPWRDISIKDNKLIFKVFRSNVPYEAKMNCTLNTGEKFCLNVEVNDTAPFVELSYKLDYNGGCSMSMSYTNYHYHHRCSPISSPIIGEVIYTVLSKTDDDLVAAVDSKGSLTMTTYENDRESYTGWVVFRVYNNGGHGDYLLSCARNNSGSSARKNIQEGF